VEDLRFPSVVFISSGSALRLFAIVERAIRPAVPKLLYESYNMNKFLINYDRLFLKVANGMELVFDKVPVGSIPTS